MELCSICKTLLTTKEAVAYRGRCEDCWSDTGRAYGPRAAKARVVLAERIRTGGRSPRYSEKRG